MCADVAGAVTETDGDEGSAGCVARVAGLVLLLPAQDATTRAAATMPLRRAPMRRWFIVWGTSDAETATRSRPTNDPPGAGATGTNSIVIRTRRSSERLEAATETCAEYSPIELAQSSIPTLPGLTMTPECGWCGALSPRRRRVGLGPGGPGVRRSSGPRRRQRRSRCAGSPRRGPACGAPCPPPPETA